MDSWISLGWKVVAVSLSGAFAWVIGPEIFPPPRRHARQIEAQEPQPAGRADHPYTGTSRPPQPLVRRHPAWLRKHPGRSGHPADNSRTRRPETGQVRAGGGHRPSAPGKCGAPAIERPGREEQAEVISSCSPGRRAPGRNPTPGPRRNDRAQSGRTRSCGAAPAWSPTRSHGSPGARPARAAAGVR